LAEIVSNFVDGAKSDLNSLTEEYLKRASLKNVFKYFLDEALNTSFEINNERIEGLLKISKSKNFL
jgi:hypothetical protein